MSYKERGSDKEKKRGKGKYAERGCGGGGGREKNHMCIWWVTNGLWLVAFKKLYAKPFKVSSIPLYVIILVKIQ